MWKVLLAVGAATVNFLVPMQYQGIPDHPVKVIFADQKHIDWYCGKASPGFYTLACAKDPDVIIMPNPCIYPEYKNPDSYARLMCHEKGHLMGWHHVDE
jgi:hypothetical protein